MCARLRDLLPKHHTELLLSFDEYVDTWSELIVSGYDAIEADEEIAPSLGLDEDASVRFSIETILALCYDAMRTFRRGRRVSDKFVSKLETGVVTEVGKRIVGEEAAAELLNLYNAHEPIFSQLLPHTGRTNEDGEKRELVGVARYIASRTSPRDEDKNVHGIETLSIHLVETHTLFCKLDANSIPDGNTMMFKKPRFIVREELA